MKKKILFSSILIVFIISIIIIVVIVNSNKESSSSNSNTIGKSSSTSSEGTNLSSSKEKLILKDNYFLTQINEILYNPKDYIGREIEIEGFPMSSENYTFVARYGPACCVTDGYAYMEYEYDGEIDLVNEQDWIKVTGIIEEGNDGTTDYVYIKASSVEKMTERGLDTISN